VASQHHVRIGLVLALAVAVAGLWVLIHRAIESGFDSAAFLASLTQSRPGWFLAAWVVTMLSLLGRAIRWQVMIRPLKPHASLWSLFVSTVIGYTALILLGRPGEFVRPWLISRRENVALSSQIAAWTLERVYDMLLILGLFGYALVLVLENGTRGGVFWQRVLEAGGWFAGITGTICLAVLITVHRFPDLLEQRFTQAVAVIGEPYRARAVQILQTALAGVRSTRDYRSVAALLWWSAVEWLLVLVVYWSVFRAFPQTAGLGPAQVIVYTGFVTFGSIVQIPGIGGGFQVVSALVLNEIFGVALEPASMIALTTWIISFVGIVPVGLSLTLHEGIRWASLRNLKAEVEP
jgi:uncharacterized membrane protein YbhN (UPF0104 family)